MLKVGLTGNMGSGKTVVASIFSSLGVPVFYADPEAKKLYEQEEVRMILRDLFGPGIFSASGEVDRKLLSEEVFSDPARLNRLNQVIHPLVREKYLGWLKAHVDSPYTIYEAAILFESGFHTGFDRIILVTAPEPLRIRRVMDRDGLGESEIKARMGNQWSEAKKVPLADFIIRNDGSALVIPQVRKVHGRLMEICC